MYGNSDNTLSGNLPKPEEQEKVKQAVAMTE
jgi:hypothetical protein